VARLARHETSYAFNGINVGGLGNKGKAREPPLASATISQISTNAKGLPSRRAILARNTGFNPDSEKMSFPGSAYKMTGSTCDCAA
jgi:hypothetical protein